jgi:hypothetical protein
MSEVTEDVLCLDAWTRPRSMRLCVKACCKFSTAKGTLICVSTMTQNSTSTMC